MKNYTYCPNCHLTSVEANHDLVTVYECKECGNIGCFGNKILSSSVGCWQKQSCPQCDRSDYKKIGYIA
jgi:ribosomal protein L37AE/L43A